MVDCLVTNISAGGVHVSSECYLPFPDEVTIKLPNGDVWPAMRRRWQRGLRAGFEFTR